MAMTRFHNILCLIALTFFACKEKEQVMPLPEATPNVQVMFEFTPMVNQSVLTPTTAYYKNESNDTYSITKFNYYISNISFIGDDGVFKESESYHLIQHCESKNTFTVSAVTPGNYKKIRFLIGVDSLRNVSGSQTGALDPVHQMFWEWNSGYIFYKLEGTFVSKNSPTEDVYNIHVGGFKGEDNCMRWVELTLPTVLIVNEVNRKVNINTNVAEVFKSPSTIGFDDYFPVVSTIFPKLADNYQDMFTIKSIE